MEAAQAPDALVAEHGFSVLVTVTKAGREHRFLFDAGTSPDGVVREHAPAGHRPRPRSRPSCAATATSTTPTGIDGLIRAVGRANMPVLIHPHFWRRRRVVLPGREPLEIPTTSRRALAEAGLRHHRGAAAELPVRPVGAGHRRGARGSPATSPASRRSRPGSDGGWQPDPLVLDDQALIVNVAGQGAGGHHRLRPRRRGQHRPVRPAPDRRPAAVRAARRVPPQRPDVRAADPARPGRPGRA